MRNKALLPDLNPNIIRNLVAFNEPTYEAEVRVARRWVRDFNLFEAAANEMFEEDSLLPYSHRVCESLISITQVGREPYRRPVYGF